MPGRQASMSKMKLAAVNAIADLAMVEHSDVVTAAYGEQPPNFGPSYIIPNRLILG